MRHRLGYLSGAPRVSTRPESELVGPKTHILGTIKGFEEFGWEVKTYIVGDRAPIDWIKKDSENKFRKSGLRLILADLTRLIMGVVNSTRSYRELGQEVDWVYERLAIFQILGLNFKRNGKFWILETNAPLALESKKDRHTIFLFSLARYLEYKAYRECDVLICISETLAKIIIEQAGIASKKVLIVPNGVDTSFFDPAFNKPLRLAEDFSIGFVGNFSSYQGLELLFEAVKNLRGEGLEIKIILVGDGPERKALQNNAEQLGLSDQILFVGFVPQSKVPEYISGFDVGYSGQTERTERRMYCSPIKVYEYMAMATPAIASDYEDTRRVINKETGFLFEVGNRKDLESKIRSAYHSRGDLPAMGRKAREVVLFNHSWTARISELLSTIESRGLACIHDE